VTHDGAVYAVKVTRAGWFNFEGFGRPFEGWVDDSGKGFGRRTAGRAFTAGWCGGMNEPTHRTGGAPYLHEPDCSQTVLWQQRHDDNEENQQ
jgi:hypothetical protein